MRPLAIAGFLLAVAGGPIVLSTTGGGSTFVNDGGMVNGYDIYPKSIQIVDAGADPFEVWQNGVLVDKIIQGGKLFADGGFSVMKDSEKYCLSADCAKYIYFDGSNIHIDGTTVIIGTGNGQELQAGDIKAVGGVTLGLRGGTSDVGSNIQTSAGVTSAVTASPVFCAQNGSVYPVCVRGNNQLYADAGIIANGFELVNTSTSKNATFYVNGHVGLGLSDKGDLPATADATTYASYWLANGASIHGDDNAAYQGVYMSSNIRRISAGSGWGLIDTAVPGWTMLVAAGSSTDYLDIQRTAAGGDPNSPTSLMRVNSAGNTLLGSTTDLSRRLVVTNGNTTNGPTQSYIQSTGSGAVGIQFKNSNVTSGAEWQTFITNDSVPKFKVGKAGVADYLIIRDTTPTLEIPGSAMLDGGVTLGGTGTLITASYATTITATGPTSGSTCADTQATLTGVTTGADCVATDPATPDVSLLSHCRVSAADTVKLRLCCINTVSCTTTSQSYPVRVWNR